MEPRDTVSHVAFIQSHIWQGPQRQTGAVVVDYYAIELCESTLLSGSTRGCLDHFPEYCVNKCMACPALIGHGYATAAGGSTLPAMHESCHFKSAQAIFCLMRLCFLAFRHSSPPLILFYLFYEGTCELKAGFVVHIHPAKHGLVGC